MQSIYAIYICNVYIFNLYMQYMQSVYAIYICNIYMLYIYAIYTRYIYGIYVCYVCICMQSLRAIYAIYLNGRLIRNRVQSRKGRQGSEIIGFSMGR